MATLQALVPYLEKGYCVQNVRGESFRTQDSWIEWSHRTWSGRQEVEKCSLSQVAGMRDVWDYGVLFFQGGKSVLATTIEEIEALIARGTPGLAYTQKEER